MKQRTEHRAVVTIQAASILGFDFVEPPNPTVLVLVMVPKGKHNVTVPTNCSTEVIPNTRRPIWNQTFSIPIRRESDVLVFQLFDCKLSSHGKGLGKLHNRISHHEQRNTFLAHPGSDDGSPARDPGGDQNSSTKNLARGDSLEPEDDDSSGKLNKCDMSNMSATRLTQKRSDDEILGACMFPADMLPESGEVIHQKLEIFESAKLDSASAGTLYIAAKLETTHIELLEKSDLHSDLLSKYHRSRLRAFRGRFLAIGELAAFLHEEAFSNDIEATWDRAVTILAEQLAYRIYETTDSTADRANFATAKTRILEDGGLWDGM